MKIFKSYKTEMDPTNLQATAFLRHSGVARFAYNWVLAQKKKAMDAKEGIPNYIELNRRLNALKKTDFPWMTQCSSRAPQEALSNLDKAFDNFFRKRKTHGKRNAGFPRFKFKKNGVGSFRLKGSIRVFGKAIQLPRIGRVRLKEFGYIPTQGVKILSATISGRAGRWFASVNVEQEIPEPSPRPKSIVGIDLGIKTLATCSDGKIFENHKPLRNRLKKLRRLSRSVSRKVNGSANRKKAARRLAKLHYRISNIRKDVLHKMTTALTKTNSTCVIEDLNVAGMLKNRSLSRAISDVGFGEFRRQLEYKGKLYGCDIVVANRFFPSSRTCSECGAVNDGLKLSDRSWNCQCGATHDRDLNAAINLRKLAVSSTDRINDCEVGLPLAA